MAWLDAFRWHPEGIFTLRQETLKRGDGLVFDSGAPDGDEEGGTVYNINPSKQGSAEADNRVELKFGPGQLNFRRVKVSNYSHPPTQASVLPVLGLDGTMCSSALSCQSLAMAPREATHTPLSVKIRACRPRRINGLLGDAMPPGWRYWAKATRTLLRSLRHSGPLHAAVRG